MYELHVRRCLLGRADGRNQKDRGLPPTRGEQVERVPSEVAFDTRVAHVGHAVGNELGIIASRIENIWHR
jgi:hypothetical protein